jgi:POT family proton-dependent oligopeptide transporter
VSATKTNLLGQLSQFERPFWMLNIMEMIERLAYYGVRVVIPIYIAQADEINGLHFTQIQKGTIFFVWALVQSLVPMFSGGFADRYGYKKTIAWSIALKACGYLLMATQRDYFAFMFGCSVLALGTAIFKPGIQGTLVQSIKNETSSVGWGTFYMVVNIGGFLGPPLAHFLYGISWPAVFYGCAVIVSLNFFMLFTYKEVPAGGDQTGTPWTIFKTTCINMARPWWLVPVAGLAIPVAYLLPLPDSVQLAVVAVSLGALIIRTTRVGAFIWLMSGFWLMFMQLFDMLPNFIVDWVDSSSIVTALNLPSWMTTVTPRGTMITQEWMINANAGLIVICVVFVSYMVSRMRRLTAILLGMTIAAAGLVFAGFTMSGYLCILGILCFSVGEMLASPKMNEYLGVIAPEGQKALYMGYANIPLAIGWSYGSLMGGEVYDRLGDKANLSLNYLASKFGITSELSKDAIVAKVQAAGVDSTRAVQAVTDAFVQGEGIARTKATAFLGTVTGMDANQVATILWNSYHPYKLWYQFAAIGFASAIGIAIYSHFAHKWQSKDV